MAIPNKQIGWSQEANLIWEISRQLEQLIGVASTTTPTTTIAPYKSYVALLSQTGGDAPSETVIENTIGIEPNSWIRDSSGMYRLSPSTSGLFTNSKTVIFINNCDATGSAQAELSTNITSKLSTPDQIYVYTYDSSNSFSDDILKQCSIEIRVYN